MCHPVHVAGALIIEEPGLHVDILPNTAFETVTVIHYLWSSLLSLETPVSTPCQSDSPFAAISSLKVAHLVLSHAQMLEQLSIITYGLNTSATYSS